MFFLPQTRDLDNKVFALGSKFHNVVCLEISEVWPAFELWLTQTAVTTPL